MVTKYLPYATHRNLIEKRNEERKRYLTLSKREESGLETQEKTLLCCMRLKFVEHLPLGFVEEYFKIQIIKPKNL